MLDAIRGKHQGSSISIIASGPSAILFNGSGDVSIGVNGAAVLGRHYNYFLYGDHRSHQNDWFGVRCSDVRIGARIVASMDKIMYPESRFANIERIAVPAHKQYLASTVPEPIAPHLIFKYSTYKPKKVAYNQRSLLCGGTIAGCAVQLAFLMGARQIDLYGCDFTHEYGHYFYQANRTGYVARSQLSIMNQILAEVRDYNIRVRVHGRTKLTEYDELCEK